MIRFPAPRIRAGLAVLSATLTLTACVGGPSSSPRPVERPTRPGSSQPTAPSDTTQRPYLKPTQSPIDTRGLERIMGATPDQLVAQFGQPRLDVIEPYGRKLQFTGDPCVLDAYLYADRNGTEHVTHVDARSHDGVAVDRAICADALRSIR